MTMLNLYGNFILSDKGDNVILLNGSFVNVCSSLITFRCLIIEFFLMEHNLDFSFPFHILSVLKKNNETSKIFLNA